jgi:hypothetical protein
MWKHFASSLWMNATNFIFLLLHILNFLTLVILTPLRLPYAPSANYAHLLTNYGNKYNDCTNTFSDWLNISTHLANTLDRLFSDLYIPNPSFLQLLLMNLLIIYRLKINIVLTARSSICSSSSIFYIYGFYISTFIFLLCIKILHLNSTCTLFPIY